MKRNALVIVIVLAAVTVMVWAGVVNYRHRKEENAKLRQLQAMVAESARASGPADGSADIVMNPLQGQMAPTFTLKDTSGHKVSLSDYKGKAVIVDFWATWCAPCVEELPSLVEMQRRMKAKGVTVLAVSVDVDEGAYKQFVKDHNVNLLTVRDPSGKSNGLYGTFKFPETYVIDRNGVMRRKFIGPVDWTETDVTEFLGKL